MGCAVGYDFNWQRDIGYGVPAKCDHPGCDADIDRGLSYVCGGEPYGGDDGCGLFFCEKHLWHHSTEDDRGPHIIQLCERCINDMGPFEPTSDVPEWIDHKLTDESWKVWRENHPLEVEAAQNAIGKPR